MSTRDAMRLGALLALLAAAPALRAQDEVAALPLRVVAVQADGKVVVDRGARDQVRVGDRVSITPPDRDAVRALVVQVDERSAVVQLEPGAAPPPVGARGEIRVPQARLRSAQPTPPATARPTAPPAPTPTTANPPPTAPAPAAPPRDDGWKPGMPLLAGVKPLRPDERAPAVTGRFYSLLGLRGDTLNNDVQPVARAGIDLDAENPLADGGALHFDAELDYRRMLDDSERGAFLLRRLSYRLGGDRFERDRFEFGRFLNDGFAALGVVDGAQWTRRFDDGSRIGASLGFLPVPDDEFQSFADLQLAAWGEWVADPDGTTRIGGALQKTWHNGRPDRDALLLSLHQAPIDGWQLHATAQIDFYFGADDQKGRGVELTNGSATLGRRFANTGFDLGWRRTRWPELLRHEFLGLSAAQIANDRVDRLVLDTYANWDSGLRTYANLSGFDDEERTGGAAELGVAVPEWAGAGSQVDLQGFGGRGQQERMVGGRLAVSRLCALGHWSALYEIGWHRLDDRPTDGNDLIQHRLALSLDHRTEGGWILGVTADAVVWDQDLSWSLQFTVNRSF